MKFEQPPKPKEETPLEEHKKAIQRGKEKLLREEYLKKKEEKEKAREEAEKTKKEELKRQGREILKKFFEKEEEKRQAILIDEGEQEKLIEEALREREAKRLLEESPARESLEIAQKELLESKELSQEEKAYLEKGEISEKRETELLTETKKWETFAEEHFKKCDEIEKQMKERGIDVDKMGLSVKERVKFSIKSLFDKKLRTLRVRHDMALAEAMDAKNEAISLRMAATNPEKYKEWIMERAIEEMAARKMARKPKELPRRRLGLSLFEAGF